MTKFYLIRHGETAWNESGKYQGHSDIALSERGRRQAQKLARYLEKEKIAAVYASDLSRALETAGIIAAPHKLPVIPLPEFRELNFGSWEGLTHEEITANFAQVVTEWLTHPGSLLLPKGESFELLKERAYEATLDLVQRHPGETIVLVTHGGTIRAIICAILELDLDKVWRLRQDNAAINIIEFYSNRAVLSLFNHTTHLCC